MPAVRLNEPVLGGAALAFGPETRAEIKEQEAARLSCRLWRLELAPMRRQQVLLVLDKVPRRAVLAVLQHKVGVTQEASKWLDGHARHLHAGAAVKGAVVRDVRPHAELRARCGLKAREAREDSSGHGAHFARSPVASARQVHPMGNRHTRRSPIQRSAPGPASIWQSALSPAVPIWGE